MSEQKWAKIMQVYAESKAATTWLSNYHHTDIAIVRMDISSRMDWVISPPHSKRLLAYLESSR
jgi:hypothetical protein